MKKKLCLILVMCLVLAVPGSVWAGEDRTSGYTAADAVIEGVSEAQVEQIYHFLEQIIRTGVIDTLETGTPSGDITAAFTAGTDGEGRKELIFENGFVPQPLSGDAADSVRDLQITRIGDTRDRKEIRFRAGWNGQINEYRAEAGIPDDQTCVLYSIRQDYAAEIIEAVSEVFEDYTEEYIEPLYSPEE